MKAGKMMTNCHLCRELQISGKASRIGPAKNAANADPAIIFSNYEEMDLFAEISSLRLRT